MNLFFPPDINTLIEREADKLSCNVISGPEIVRIKDKSKFVLEQMKKKFTPGTVIEFVSEGQFDMHQLLFAMLEYTGIADVLFTTYAIKEFQARQLHSYLEKNLVNSYRVLLDYRIIQHDRKVCQFINQFMRVAHTNIHAKIIVVKGVDKSICAVTSANFTKNYRVEAGVISCSKESADFYGNFINRYFYDKRNE